jgi:hypothetical protein
MKYAVWCSAQEWNDEVEQRAAKQENDRKQADQKAIEEAKTAELIRMQKEKFDVCSFIIWHLPLAYSMQFTKYTTLHEQVKLAQTVAGGV